MTEKRCQTCGNVVIFPDSLTEKTFKEIAAKHLRDSGGKKEHYGDAVFANIGSSWDTWRNTRLARAQLSNSSPSAMKAEGDSARTPERPQSEQFYGLSKTQTTNPKGKWSIVHIARDRSLSLCGVPLASVLLNTAGWNLCAKCWYTATIDGVWSH